MTACLIQISQLALNHLPTLFHAKNRESRLCDDTNHRPRSVMSAMIVKSSSGSLGLVPVGMFCGQVRGLDTFHPIL